MLQTLATADLEQQVTSFAVRLILVCGILLIAGVAAALLLKRRKKLFKLAKLPLFLLIAGSMVIGTVGLMASTVYLNMKAESGGPVHWHADIEFWVCGTEMELRDPTGFLSNKIGSATYHEHNDKRIHLEGVVVKKTEDAGLEKFMRVTGGSISTDTLTLPLNDNQEDWFASAANDKVDGDIQDESRFANVAAMVQKNEEGSRLTVGPGATCNNLNAELQTFVYTYDKESKTYSQRKLSNPAEYIMRDEPIVPPGDCVIVEFDTPKAQTDKLCLQYGVRDISRCMEFGVEEFSEELCNIRQVTTSGGEN